MRGIVRHRQLFPTTFRIKCCDSRSLIRRQTDTKLNRRVADFGPVLRGTSGFNANGLNRARGAALLPQGGLLVRGSALSHPINKAIDRLSAELRYNT
jgi:hypothetical protein